MNEHLEKVIKQARPYENGKAEGRREMALELAEWHEEQAKNRQSLSDKLQKAKHGRYAHEMRGEAIAYKASAAECRRRAGE